MTRVKIVAPRQPISPTLNAVKELKAENELLKKRIDRLEMERATASADRE